LYSYNKCHHSLIMYVSKTTFIVKKLEIFMLQSGSQQGCGERGDCLGRQVRESAKIPKYLFLIALKYKKLTLRIKRWSKNCILLQCKLRVYSCIFLLVGNFKNILEGSQIFNLPWQNFSLLRPWLQLLMMKYRWTSLYARDKDSKNTLTYNESAYKKTKKYCKLEDRLQKKGYFWIAYMRNCR